MKALVLQENGRLSYTSVADPQSPRPGSLLVRVVAAGICGSDIHRAFENGAYHYPLIMGHEMECVVEDPADSDRFATGDRVAVFPLLPCHRCGPCQTGDFAQCVDYDYYGSRRHGGFAEYLRVPEENLFPVPPHVRNLHAAMTEPCAVALHAVRRMRVDPGASGAVFGGGPIGNMAAQWLRFAGCRPVVVVDIDPAKLAVAADMGFEAVNSAQSDPVTAIQERCSGGADCVIEAVGLPITFLQCLQCAARSGQVVFMGNITGRFQIAEQDFSSILRRELRIYGTWNSRVTPRGSDDWSTVLRMLDREIDVGPLISHTPRLEEGPEIFARMAGRKEPFARVIFRIGD